MFRFMLSGLVGTILVIGPVAAAPKGPPGATATELIAFARQLSPELAAAALTAEAATARIISAGALPDPTLRVDADNLDSRNVSMNGPTYTFRLMQEFPLWGKRELKSDMANFEATAARFRSQSAQLDLVARVKSVFAARYATFRAQALTQKARDTVLTAAATLRDRYAQGGTTQEDVLRLEIEGEELQIEIERLRGQETKTEAQLDALLNRSPNAPLAIPVALRPLPVETKLNVASAKEAEVSAASAERAAAEQRSSAVRVTLRGEVVGMLAVYRATAKNLDILQQHHLAKSEQVVQLALTALQTGQGDVLRVLDAIRRVRNVQLEILKVQVEQQTSLAEIEKAIGGDL